MHGQCRGDRRPVGRRGQGQDRRLAVAARRCRGALPGRPQCRPHAGHRRRRVPPEPAAVGRGAAGQAVDHRQRRGGRSLGAACARSRRSARKGVDVTPAILAARRQRHPDPAARTREIDRAREEARGDQQASAPPAAASARPTRTRSAAAPSASATSPTRTALADKLDQLLLHHNALLRGLGAAEVERAAAARRRSSRSRPRCCPMPTRCGSGSTRRARAGRRILFEGAQGVMLDVDHGTYPLRHLVPHPSGPGGGGLGHRAGRGRLRARHHQGLHDARRQRPVPDRADRRASASCWASAARSSASSPGASGAAAGSTR